MSAYTQFLQDFILWSSEHLQVSSVEEELIRRARNLLAAEQATLEAKMTPILERNPFLTHNQLRCPKSPDGVHLFQFGTKAATPGICTYCGVNHVKSGEIFIAQDTDFGDLYLRRG